MTVQVAGDQDLLQEFQNLIERIGEDVVAKALVPALESVSQKWETQATDLQTLLAQTGVELQAGNSAFAEVVRELQEVYASQDRAVSALLEGLTNEQKLLARRVVTELDGVRNDIEALLCKQEESVAAVQQRLFESVDEIDRALDHKVMVLFGQAETEIVQGHRQTKEQIAAATEQNTEQITALADYIAQGQKQQRKISNLIIGSIAVLVGTVGTLIYLLLEG